MVEIVQKGAPLRRTPIRLWNHTAPRAARVILTKVMAKSVSVEKAVVAFREMIRESSQ